MCPNVLSLVCLSEKPCVCLHKKSRGSPRWSSAEKVNSAGLTGPARQICVHVENFHPTSLGSRLAQGGISPSRAGLLPI